MTDQNKISLANEKLLQALLDGKLIHIAETIYELFHMPILIADASSHVLCQIPQKCLGEKHWDEQFLNHKLSLTKEEIIQLEYRLSHTLEEQIAYLDSDAAFSTPYIVGEFYNGHFPAGHFSILCMDWVPDQEDLAIARLFGKVLSHFFTYQQSLPLDALMNHAFLSQLLEYESMAHVKADTAPFQNLSLRFQLLVCPLTKQQTLQSNSYLYNYLHNNFKQVYTAVYQEHLVLLICSGHEKSSAASQITDFLLTYNFTVSTSKPFFHLDDVKNMYAQTLLTLKIGQFSEPAKKLYQYEDYAPMQIFVPVAELMDPQVWYHPLFEKIYMLDKESHTQYLETLMQYFFCGGNKKLTAKTMHIHINTLNYRLDKIRNYINLDELTPNDILNFELNYYLSRLEGFQG